jgi:tetratricopeptide (TPR) repeat protein
MQLMTNPSSTPPGRSFALGLCFSAVLAVAQASANGGGGSSGGGSSSGGNSGAQNQSGSFNEQTTDMTTCPKGHVWSVKRKACVRMHSGVLPDDAMADYAYALAKADRYAEALDVLDLMTDQNTPKALNYRGYATRKLGRTDEGIGYYLRSVALDPHYAQVREYLGEAYVIKGRLDLAKDQLTTIKTLCGTDCEQYRDLSEAIEKAGKI